MNLDGEAAALTDVPYGPVDISGRNKWIQPINIAKEEIPDPRNLRPYPEFANNSPNSLCALMN